MAALVGASLRHISTDLGVVFVMGLMGTAPDRMSSCKFDADDDGATLVRAKAEGSQCDV